MLKAIALSALAISQAACVTTPARSDDEAALAIIGAWRQGEVECGIAEPVRELIFEADGRYSVTWLPFETHRDYWGRYRYNPRTHALSLTVEGGNYQPPDRRLSGSAQLEGRTLTLNGISLGTPEYGQRCTAPFRR